MICPQCQHRFNSVGQTNYVCAKCGHRWRGEAEAENTEMAESAARQRRFWRRWFWMLFVLGPVIALPGRFGMLKETLSMAGMIGILACGAFASGYCLARALRARADLLSRVGTMVIIATAVGVVYVGIGVAFCFLLLLLSNRPFRW